MVEEHEVLVLTLGLGVSVLIAANRTWLQRIPARRILLVGFAVSVAGWGTPILEGTFRESGLNIVEHLCYLGSSLLLALWCWKVFR